MQEKELAHGSHYPLGDHLRRGQQIAHPRNRQYQRTQVLAPDRRIPAHAGVHLEAQRSEVATIGQRIQHAHAPPNQWAESRVAQQRPAQLQRVSPHRPRRDDRRARAKGFGPRNLGLEYPQARLVAVGQLTGEAHEGVPDPVLAVGLHAAARAQVLAGQRQPIGLDQLVDLVHHFEHALRVTRQALTVGLQPETGFLHPSDRVARSQCKAQQAQVLALVDGRSGGGCHDAATFWLQGLGGRFGLACKLYASSRLIARNPGQVVGGGGVVEQPEAHAVVHAGLRLPVRQIDVSANRSRDARCARARARRPAARRSAHRHAGESGGRTRRPAASADAR